MLLPLGLGACQSTDTVDDAEPAAAGAVEAKPADSGTRISTLDLTPASGWRKERPSSGSRYAQYAVPGADEQDDAQLIVYYFGPGGAGDLQANLDRWCGQFAQPDGRDSAEVAVFDTRRVGELTLHTVDLSGTYVAETRPGSGERLNKPEYRMLAAVVTTGSGPYYIKLIGPAATVARSQDDFDDLLGSLRMVATESGRLPVGHP
jgi:hypothetical protein